MSHIVICVLLSVMAVALGQNQTVPGGRMFHRDCIHSLPDGAFVQQLNKTHLKVIGKNGRSKVLAPCKHTPRVPGAMKGGWKAYTSYYNTGITSLYGEWRVPPAPPGNAAQLSSGPQPTLLYYWNGLETPRGTQVIQPVLQWGFSGAGGGAFWSVASWWVGPGNRALHTKAFQVNPGDVIAGYTYHKGNGVWAIVSKNKNTGHSTTLNFHPTESFPWAFNVVETYDVFSCNVDNPSTHSIVFDKMSVHVHGRPVGVQWKAQKGKSRTCGEVAHVHSSNRVSVSWN